MKEKVVIEESKEEKAKYERSEDERSKYERSKYEGSEDERSKDKRSKDERSKDKRSKYEESKDKRLKDEKIRTSGIHAKAKNRIRNCFIVILMMCIIAVTFMLPSLVFAVEDRRLTNYDIHYAAEPVKVVSNKIPLTEKLSLEPQLINEGSYIVLDPDNMARRDIHYEMNPENILDTARKVLVYQFVEILVSEKNKKEIFTFMENAIVEVKPLLMIKSESSDMFLVWAVNVYNEDSNFTIIIDDETEKLLSLQCVYHLKGEYVEKEVNGTEFGRKLANIYGYEYLSMDRIASTRLRSIKVKMKDKNMESSIKSGESVIGCYMESYYSDTDNTLTLLYNCVDDENYEYYNKILIDEYEDE